MQSVMAELQAHLVSNPPNQVAHVIPREVLDSELNFLCWKVDQVNLEDTTLWQWNPITHDTTVCDKRPHRCAHLCGQKSSNHIIVQGSPQV
ncbi:hypothetical protein D3C75_793500 [compost metagenome]